MTDAELTVTPLGGPPAQPGNHIVHVSRAHLLRRHPEPWLSRSADGEGAPREPSGHNEKETNENAEKELVCSDDLDSQSLPPGEFCPCKEGTRQIFAAGKLLGPLFTSVPYAAESEAR